MSVVMRNASQVDRMWTTLPVIYSLHFALFPLLNENGTAFAHNLPRVWLMAAMQVIRMEARRLEILNVCSRSCGVFDSLITRREGVSTACAYHQPPISCQPLNHSLSNEEDYRYTQWRKMVPAWFFQVFSFFFICKPFLMPHGQPLNCASQLSDNQYCCS